MLTMMMKLILLIQLVNTVYGGLYGCTNSAVTDYYRQVTYEVINQYRDHVFQGHAPNKCGGLPPAKNYYQIVSLFTASEALKVRILGIQL